MDRPAHLFSRIAQGFVRWFREPSVPVVPSGWLAPSWMRWVLYALLVLYCTEQSRGQTVVKKVLFFDDEDVLYRSGTKRVLNALGVYDADPGTPPTDAVLKPSGWDVNGSITLCSVSFVSDRSPRYMMWYQVDSTAKGFAGLDKAYDSVIAYAYSADGVTWTKPDLRSATGFSYPLGDGPNGNNIVLVGSGAVSGVRSGCSVLYDASASNADRRYKMVFTDFNDQQNANGVVAGGGLNVAFSPDGKLWTRPADPAFPFNRSSIAVGDKGRSLPVGAEEAFQILDGKAAWRLPLSMSNIMNVFIQPAHWENNILVPKRYVCYGRMSIDGPDGKMGWKNGMGRIVSSYDDFVNWSKPEFIQNTEERDERKHVESQVPGYPFADAIHDFQDCPVLNYDGVYISLAQISQRKDPRAYYYNLVDPGGPNYLFPPSIKDSNDIEMMTSRDGRHWNRIRYELFPILSRGTTSLSDTNPQDYTDNRLYYDEFDSRFVYTNSSMVVDNSIRFYYGGYGNKTGIGFATIAADRIAGVRAYWTWLKTGSSSVIPPTGQVTLKPVSLTGISRLTLNAEVHSGGSIKCEVLDGQYYRVSGFTKDKSNALPAGSHVDAEVTWAGNSIGAVAPLVAAPLVRIHLVNATLYNCCFWSNNASVPSLETDSDTDGMPDAYELANGLDKSNRADADADLDGDGVSNLKEYLAATDPLSPLSRLCIVNVAPAERGTEITFTSAPDVFYVIEATSSLVEPNWQETSEVIHGSGGEVTVVASSSATSSQRFYRIRVVSR